MSFQSLRLYFTTLLVSLLLGACGGGDASSAAAPTDLTVTTGNGQVTLKWTPVAGVEYWVMYAPTSDPIDIKNPPGVHYWLNNVTSPLVIPGLTNGQAYSFAMDARINGGKGGAQTTSMNRTPRLGGAAWSAGSGLDNHQNFKGLAYGTATDASLDYIAVGSGGSIYKSTYLSTDNALTWSSTASGLAINFTAVTYAFGKFIAVGSGAGNNIVSSADLTTWASATTAIASGLNAVATDGVTVVAVGGSGQIYWSADALSWTAATVSGVNQNLQGVAYLASGSWVALGDGGTLLTSADGRVWARSSATLPAELVSTTLRAAASVGSTWVVVGDAGKLMTSTDSGATWIYHAVSTTSSPNLYAVNGSSTTLSAAAQFLAVGASGAVYSSPDGSVWTAQSAGMSNDLYGLLGSATLYIAVGGAGTSRISQ